MIGYEKGDRYECFTDTSGTIWSVLGCKNCYNCNDCICCCSMMKILPILVLAPGLAVASESQPPPPTAVPVIPVHGQKLKPSPCDLQKKITVKKDKDGREIITTETSADCRYDSNMVKKQKEFEKLVKRLIHDLNYKYHDLDVKLVSSQERQNADLALLKARLLPKPVDRKPVKEDSSMVINFMIGMLEGIKEW